MLARELQYRKAYELLYRLSSSGTSPSSYMARRTFIGNIYRLVKDPNLVSALTGHVEGSRAFSRYRTIDIDMKKDLVKILEGAK